MDRHAQNRERFAIKMVLGSLAALLLFIGGCVAGYHFFQQWQGARLVRRAQAFLGAHDLKSAALSARRAYQINHKNFLAARVLAEAAESQNDPAVIAWREIAFSNSPDRVTDGIALARCALQFDKLPLAEATLAKLPPEAATRADFHAIEAQVAIAQKDSHAAEQHYDEAVRLEPDNKVYQLNQAIFRLQSPSAETRNAASLLLQKDMEDPALRVAAGRAMRDYALQRKDYPALLQITDLLSRFPEALFRDRISYLQVLRALDRPEFPGKLTELEEEAATNAAKLNELLSWMSANRMAVLAISWARTLPADILATRPVPLALAECYAAASDWDGLQAWCKKGNWQDLEFFRHAFLARAARERGDKLTFAAEWNLALGGVGTDGERTFVLEQAVSKWDWKKEAADLLWLLRNDPARRVAALDALYQYYATQNATGDLYRVSAEIAEIKKDDANAQNNLAQLALLLRVDLSRACDLARDLHERDPQNPTFASTYAYSLYVQGKPAQAAKVMSEFSAENLQKPEFAAYYGIFLAAAGEKQKAAAYLARGAAARLLPEEKAQYDSAKKIVGPAVGAGS